MESNWSARNKSTQLWTPEFWTVSQGADQTEWPHEKNSNKFIIIILYKTNSKYIKVTPDATLISNGIVG